MKLVEITTAAGRLIFLMPVCNNEHPFA